MNRRSGLRLALALGAFVLLAWAIPRHPAYQRWRRSRLTLAQMTQACGPNGDAAAREGDYPLLYATGLGLNAQKQFAQSLPLLLKAVQLNPDAPAFRDALAQTQVANGQTDEAFQQLSQFVGTHPNLASAHLLLGKLYLATHSGPRAQQELERAVALDANLAEGWAALAGARGEFSADKRSVLEAATRAAALRPTNVDDQLRLASLLAEQSPDEARAVYERALALAPDRADAHRAFARYLLDSGRPLEQAAQAEAEARLARALDARSPQASLLLGLSLTRRRAYADAIEPLTLAAQGDVFDTVAPHNLATLYRRLNRPKEARQWQTVWQGRQAYLSERLRLRSNALARPQDRARSGRLARLLARHGEVEEALRYQSLAQGQPPDAPAVLLGVANDLMQGGFRDLAVPLAERAHQRKNRSASEAGRVSKPGL